MPKEGTSKRIPQQQNHHIQRTSKRIRLQRRVVGISGTNDNRTTSLQDDDTLQHVFRFVGKYQYRFIAAINHQFQRMYNKTFSSADSATNSRETKTYCNITNITVTHFCYEEIPYEHKNRLINVAAYQGNLKKLQYIHNIVGQMDFFDSNTIPKAAINGHLHVIKYLREKGCEWGDICRTAVRSGQLDVLKYAYNNGCPFTPYIINLAAGEGQLHILRYVRRKGCVWDEATCYNAVWKGHLHILQYLHENGCPWNKEVCETAADSGRLDILQYAHMNDCPWDADTILRAASSGHVHIMQYAINHNCPMDDIYAVLSAAMEGKHYNVIEWMKNNLDGEQFDSTFFDWKQFMRIHFE